MVRLMRFELTRPYGHYPLKVARLPFRHNRDRKLHDYYIISLQISTLRNASFFDSNHNHYITISSFEKNGVFMLVPRIFLLKINKLCYSISANFFTLKGGMIRG